MNIREVVFCQVMLKVIKYKLWISTFKPTEVLKVVQEMENWIHSPTRMQTFGKAPRRPVKKRWNCLVKHESLPWTIIHRVSVSALPVWMNETVLIVPLCVAGHTELSKPQKTHRPSQFLIKQTYFCDDIISTNSLANYSAARGLLLISHNLCPFFFSWHVNEGFSGASNSLW